SKPLVAIKLRCPEGKTISRRFYKTDHLYDLLNFVTSQGFPVERYKLLTAYPRRDVSLL
ncbi:hypothetical protein HELRODRAFT_138403, partial [Helobdella robusta]|uniref:UBX domain-containing protein n=1 Tax=Helobdella robusta TaxID=6412 RepID=T1EIU8_HELRO